jgi:hypothetical protein
MEYRPSSIASHIPDQFPKIYREDGPDFIEFVKAYYEYLDNTSERNFSALGDIDNTLERFLKHYKNKYLNGLPFPESSTQDIPFIVKNIADLYRSKGTQEALELMFRMFYKQEIEVYYPASSILTLSDSKWAFSTYLEFKPISNTATFPVQRGDIIEGDSSKATAFVDEIVFYNIDGVQVPVGYISNVYGKFNSDDALKVTRAGVDSFPGKLIYGSIAKPEVLDKDATASNKVGDKLKLESSLYGEGGEGVVREISPVPTGTIEWELENGGWGYDTTSPVGGQTFAQVNDNNILISSQVLVISADASAVGTINPGDIVTTNAGLYGGPFGNRTNGGMIDAATGQYDNDYRLYGTATVIKYEYPLLFVSSYAGYDPTTFTADDFTSPLGPEQGGTYYQGAFHVRNGTDLTQVVQLEDIPDYNGTIVVINPDQYNATHTTSSTPIAINAISDFNDSAKFDFETFNNTETVTFFTDVIGDFANQQLQFPVIDVTQFTNSALETETVNKDYEIVTTGNTDFTHPFFGAENNLPGTTFAITQAQWDAHYPPPNLATMTGQILSRTDSNYGMTGAPYSDYRSRLADALGSKTTELGSLNTIKVTSSGSGYENDARSFIRNNDMYKFEYTTIAVRFDKSNFGMQIGDIIEQTIQVPDLTKDSNDEFINIGQTISYTAKAKLIKKEDDTFTFQPLSFYGLDINGPDITFAGNIISIVSISRVDGYNNLGGNANVEGDANYLAGRIVSVDVIKSGFRYTSGEEVKLINNDPDNENKYNAWVGSAKVTVTDAGITEGKWETTTSHLSDSNRYIHDNDYYQEYSYDVATILDPSVYEKTLKDVVHVAGTKFFGTPLVSTSNDIKPQVDSSVVQFTRREELLIRDHDGSTQHIEIASRDGSLLGADYSSLGLNHEYVYAGDFEIGTPYVIVSTGTFPDAATRNANWSVVAGSGGTFLPGTRFVATDDGLPFLPSDAYVIPARFVVELEEPDSVVVEFDS